MRKALRNTAAAAVLLLVLVAVAAGWAWYELDASLPAYSGTVTLEGLGAPVTVERDALGVATIRAAERLDEARAFGFVHAQERFFQMDLLRRSAAGELAALVGDSAVATDRARRIHELRQTAERVIRELPDDHRRLLEAYAEGVNAGLAALRARPFEYLLLRSSPEPWRAEDSILVIGAMYFDLQDEAAGNKLSELIARQILPGPVADLLYPTMTPWDAPIVGPGGPPATIPEAAVYDLRRLPVAGLPVAGDAPSRFAESAPRVLGSNNWAVGAGRTANGAAILANDPHLTQRVPSIWFRVSLDRGSSRVTGASLPGVPVVVIGSGGKVAWGLTNTEADWTDLVVLELDPEDPARYRTADGWQTIETVTSPIEVAGEDPVGFRFERSVFGPIVGALPDGRPYAVRWVAHDTRAYRLAFIDLPDAANVEEALSIAQASGLPEQNFVAVDAAGNIGWTIAGSIPRRASADLATLSENTSDRVDWLQPAEYPVIVNPDAALIWTANNRVADGDYLELLGHTSFDLGARAGQIRDRLRELDAATTADMLRIQLDDEARLLSYWRDRLLQLLDASTDPLLDAVRREVRDWGGHAAIDSVGYRLVRGWRLVMIDRMQLALTAQVTAFDPDWNYRSLHQESWARALIAMEPRHLLDPRYASWRELELDALEIYLHDLLDVRSAGDLAARTWGDYNRIRVQHPLSQAIPALSRWLDMPTEALPGDSQMPRVQTPGFGASARFAVTPGAEADGYFHMAGGQSGHPLSPYYGAGHTDWAAGRPEPFLPGAAVQTLRLEPARN